MQLKMMRLKKTQKTQGHQSQAVSCHRRKQRRRLLTIMGRLKETEDYNRASEMIPWLFVYWGNKRGCLLTVRIY